MTSPLGSPAAPEGGFLSPAPDRHPVDHCFRCGKETPAGVGLCDEHNPQHLRGPSSTQMHATVFAGIVLGVIGLFVLFRMSVNEAGPFQAEVTSAGLDGSGALAVAFVVTNAGQSDGHADCKLTRDGVARADDVAFRTPEVPAGATLSLAQTVDPAPDDGIVYVADLISVVCS